LAVINFAGEAKYDEDENLYLRAAMEVLQIKMIEKLREEMGAVYGASVQGLISKIPYENYTISINIPCKPENVDNLITTAIELVKSLIATGPSEIDLGKVKAALKNEYEENIETNRYWALVLKNAEINHINPKTILTYEKRVDAITVENVKNVANKFFDLKNFITGILLPE